MSVRSDSVHRFLRPAQPLAVGVMLAQVCTGTLVIALVVLLVPYLVAFDLAIAFASGVALVAIGVRDAERDRSILPRETWPTFKSRAVVWLSVIIFVSGPLVLMALLIDRFTGPSITAALAIGISSAGWALTSYRKLWVDELWRSRPREEEAEAGFAVGALVLTATLAVGWVLVEIDEAFRGGPLPSALTAGAGFILSLAATIIVGLAVLVPLALKWTLRDSASTATHFAFGTLLAPLAVLVLLPMHRWGQPLPDFVPAYASVLSGRVFISAVLAFSLIELLRSRKAGSKPGG